MGLISAIRIWIAVRPVKRIRRAIRRHKLRKRLDHGQAVIPNDIEEEIDVMSDQVQSLVRSILKAGCGALVAQGMIQQSMTEPLIGIGLGLVGLAWSWYTHRKA